LEQELELYNCHAIGNYPGIKSFRQTVHAANAAPCANLFASHCHGLYVPFWHMHFGNFIFCHCQLNHTRFHSFSRPEGMYFLPGNGHLDD